MFNSCTFTYFNSVLRAQKFVIAWAQKFAKLIHLIFSDLQQNPYYFFSTVKIKLQTFVSWPRPKGKKFSLEKGSVGYVVCGVLFSRENNPWRSFENNMKIPSHLAPWRNIYKHHSNFIFFNHTKKMHLRRELVLTHNLDSDILRAWILWKLKTRHRPTKSPKSKALLMRLKRV